MNKKGLNDYLHQSIRHRVLGDIVVKEITSLDEGKFIGEVQDTKDLKRFIFSNKFFISEEEIEWADVELHEAYKGQHKKQRDYSKIRNHPFVKEIDRRDEKRKNRVLPEELDE